MSRSPDPGHFFQTSQSLSETNRKNLKSKNNNGSPIRLQSKILAVAADPTDDNAVYISESVGTARRLSLGDPGRTTHEYRGPSSPLTSLALSSKNETLFAGCWDKTIWSWTPSTRAPGKRYFGHTDFVTALLCESINGNDVLVSGSSDASIIIWNIVSGEKFHMLKGHTRGILDLAFDPITLPCFSAEEPPPMILFSASSDRSIHRWSITPDLLSASQIDPENPIMQHETSVYALHFDSDSDLWTASADGTSKCLSRSHDFAPDTTLQHGDYVRTVAIDELGGWVITAGRDEHVKVWEKASGRLYHTYEGHFEEVTGLLVLPGQRVVSVGLDRTVRVWELKREELERAREIAEKAKGEVADEHVEVDVQKGKGVNMTKEEERELEELMEESE